MPVVMLMGGSKVYSLHACMLSEILTILSYVFSRPTWK